MVTRVPDDRRKTRGFDPTNTDASRLRDDAPPRVGVSVPRFDEDGLLGRRSIDKTFRGELSATSVGEMLSAGTAVKGSAGYVAIERVTGTLQGRAGSFVFQHSGTMHGGQQQLSITVVPGSGTGALAGIAGSFSLSIVDGRHEYRFDYTLP